MTTTTHIDTILQAADIDPPTWEQILDAELSSGLAWAGIDWWHNRPWQHRTPTTLYRLQAHDGQLLYIGIAGNPGRRFEQHRHDKAWWGDVATISLTHFDTRADAEAAERDAIRHEHPMHNKTHQSNGAHR